MWESTGCGRAIEAVRVLVEAESANSGFEIVVEAVKMHGEA
jgi:hypothetical protein